MPAESSFDESIVLWTVRIAVALYMIALALRMSKRGRLGRMKLARVAWTLGYIAFMIHVASAFHFYHHWSHAEAWESNGSADGSGHRAGVGRRGLCELFVCAGVGSRRGVVVDLAGEIPCAVACYRIIGTGLFGVYCVQCHRGVWEWRDALGRFGGIRWFGLLAMVPKNETQIVADYRRLICENRRQCAFRTPVFLAEYNNPRPAANNQRDAAFFTSIGARRRTRNEAMREIITKLPPDEILGLVAIVGAFVCGMLGIIMVIVMQCLHHRREQMKDSLKQDMLSRGMSAEEIVTILEAGSELSVK